MSLPNYLSSIKASGMYRFIFDKSEAPAEELQQLRLVVGYSEKGPFNTPVYIEDASDFKKTFGDISKKLERKGIFFHRMALQALKKAPILCLNLKELDNETIQGLSFDGNGALNEKITTLVSKIYNTNRFWTLEPEKLNEDNGFANYINIAATDAISASNTIFVRSYVPTGYNVTFADWYSQNTNGEEMPSYMEGYENERVEDYFAEVYVFKGQFTPALASSETLNKYFNVVTDAEGKSHVYLATDLKNAFGESEDVLDALAADSNSNFINKYSGILIPEFKNSNNTLISLDAAFNSDNTTHKMMMYLNQDLLWDEERPLTSLNTTGYDLVESVSYTPSEEEVPAHTGYTAAFASVTEDGAEVTDAEKIEADKALHDAPTEDEVKAAIEAGDTEIKYSVTKTETIEGKAEISGETSNGTAIAESKWADIEALAMEKVGDEITAIKENAKTATEETETSVTFEDNAKNVIVISYKITPASTKDIAVEITYNDLKEEFIPAKEAVAATVTVKTAEGAELLSNKSIVATAVVAEYKDGEWVFNEEMDSPSMLVYALDEDITYDEAKAGYKLPESLSNATIEVGDKIFVDGIKIVSNVITDGTDKYISLTYREDGTADDKTYKETISGTLNIFNHSIGDRIYDKMETTYLEGYTYDGGYDEFIAEHKLTKGSQWSKLQWHKSILAVLTNWKGIRTALTNRVDSEWRYLVDTFESYVEEGIHAELANICKLKENSFAILNFPSVSTLTKCEYTSFTDKNGVFQVKYIADGGNRQKPMGTKLALPTEIQGAVYSGFFTPIVITENQTKKTIPSAALVSNLFIDKLENRHAYNFVAGPNYARLTDDNLVGPEFNFDKDELGILETMGVNAIVYQPRKGTFVNSNKTAKQTPVSALSYINVIELSIFLQDEIENMLQAYQWEFNTAELRGTVKGRADKICELIQNNGGIARYYNQCDENNNTEDVINNEMFIISTSIEPGMGCGKMVQELTIYRQGGMKKVFGE